MNRNNKDLKSQDKDLDKDLDNIERRVLLEKFGRLSATVPVAMLVLMGPGASKAQASDNDSGGGF